MLKKREIPRSVEAVCAIDGKKEKKSVIPVNDSERRSDSERRYNYRKGGDAAALPHTVKR